MKILWAARYARWDLLRVINLLSTRITKWTTACDRWLYRVMCYIHSTLDLVLYGYCGDDFKNLTINMWTDADWAGDRTDWRSTSGVFVSAIGNHTDFPLYARSKKQTATATSTPEAELVAANYGTRKVLCGISLNQFGPRDLPQYNHF